jgi:CRP-like cAMP-binding protein
MNQPAPIALQQFFQSLMPITETTAIQLSDNFQFKTVLKNDFLLQENTISNTSYFLESGYVRAFTNDSSGIDITTNLFVAPIFVNNFISFFKQAPSLENLQALTDCKMWAIDYDTLQEKFHTLPAFREMGRLMLINSYSRLQMRMVSFIKETAEQRYEKLLKSNPEIFQYVPLKVLSSYLGITDTSLSRIRKSYAKK